MALLHSSDIWLPDHGLYNSMDSVELSHNSDTKIRVMNTGSYNTHARPVTNLSSPVVVDVTMFLMSFEIAEENQEFLTSGWLSFQWKNELLTWNESEYPVSKLVVSSSMVWLPSVIVVNSNNDRNVIKNSISSVQIFPDGTTRWWPDVTTTTFCPISVNKYPFDKQECPFIIASWFRSTDEQLFASSGNEIKVVTDELNTEWEYLGSSIKVDYVKQGGLSRIKIKVEVKRRPFYQIVHTLIPIILLSYMNCFIFIIPIKSGENTSFGVAIFLAFAIFIGPVKESLPVTSTETCLLTVFLIVQFCFGGLETCVSNITLRLASRTTIVSVNSWWIKLEQIPFLRKQRDRKVYPELSPSNMDIVVEEYSKTNEEREAKNQDINTETRPRADFA
ncbi:Neuronal acetylcholine receptor subunit alpha-7 [Mizuhopecten yessoensis]|uniref:Neuronal acetylcholine receptor subunit alpha-7 n=1 Tax=Mizuhopecten yessoensis TaxID=6573 RepID=A0A210QGZ2_MIZYE|nr:Neuronal acetylcholine receptor subunit alpha-7 [Mizuhopecten yessoensis]